MTGHVKDVVRRALDLVTTRRLPPPTARERALARELRETLGALAADSSTTGETWQRMTARLHGLAQRRDPRRFLRWDVVLETMFVAFARFVRKELDFLRHHPDWLTRWRPVLAESAVGQPIPYWGYPRSSGNLIHHAYHLAQCEDQAGIRLSEPGLVFEFGGGYGNFCRLFHDLGFRGRYVLYDLPAFSALQRYYLRSLQLPVLALDECDTAASGIVCSADLDAVKRNIAQHAGAALRMFVATWSLSETPVELRQAILALVADFDVYFIGYQDRFEGVDNGDFFRRWRLSQTNVRWRDWPISFLPRNRYLVGRRQGTAATDEPPERVQGSRAEPERP